MKPRLDVPRLDDGDIEHDEPIIPPGGWRFFVQPRDGFYEVEQTRVVCQCETAQDATDVANALEAAAKDAQRI